LLIHAASRTDRQLDRCVHIPILHSGLSDYTLERLEDESHTAKSCVPISTTCYPDHMSPLCLPASRMFSTNRGNPSTKIPGRRTIGGAYREFCGVDGSPPYDAVPKIFSPATAASNVPYSFTRWSPTITGNAFWAETILVSASSGKTSLLRGFLMMRSASGIATASVRQYLK